MSFLHVLQVVDLYLTCTRIDFLVMPLLMMGFFALQLDRGNMYGDEPEIAHLLAFTN